MIKEKEKKTSENNKISTIVVGTVVTCAALLLTLLAVYFYLKVFAPEPQLQLESNLNVYSKDAMQLAVQPSLIKEFQDTFVSYGSRFIGQPGVYKAEQFINSEFKKNGLDTYMYQVKTASPITEFREIYLIDKFSRKDSLLNDIEIFPFMPNQIQPVTTPDSGITGTLVILDQQTIESRKSFSNCIGLIDSKEGMYDSRYAFHWARYARLGLKAIVVSHSESLNKAPWNIIGDRFSGMVASNPVNYVRVAASPEIFKYAGEKVRIRVRSRFTEVKNTTVIGIMKAKAPSSEAVIVTANYDACSYLPDRALGVTQALNPALQLQVLKGLTAYKGSIDRDVIFMAFNGSSMAHDGLNNIIRVLLNNSTSTGRNRLLNALGIKEKQLGGETRRLRPILLRQENNGDSLKIAQTICSLFDSSSFLSDPENTDRILNKLDDEKQAFFKSQFNYVLNTLVLSLSEPMLQYKIQYERQGRDLNGREFQHYLNAKSIYDRAVSAAGYNASNLIRMKKEFFDSHEIRKLCKDRFTELFQYHSDLQTQLAQEVVIVKLMSKYKNFAVFSPLVTPAYNQTENKEIVTINTPNKFSTPALPTIFHIVSRAKSNLALKDLEVSPLDIVNIGSKIGASIGSTNVDDLAFWGKYGYPSYGLVSLERPLSFKRIPDPIDLPFMHNCESLKNTFSIFGEVILAAAHGSGKFEPVQFEEWGDKSFAGRVLVSNVGNSIVPNYPLKGALVVSRNYENRGMFNMPGIYRHPVLITDVYGRFYLPHNASDFPVWWRTYEQGGYTPIAAGIGKDGLINYMKDEGTQGQGLFKTMNLNVNDANAIKNITIVVFRAVPVTLFDITNPQTMNDYTGIQFITRDGLNTLDKYCSFQEISMNTVYIQPDKRFYVELRSGAPQNDLVQMTRGFMLGIDSLKEKNLKKEIDGKGYLAADCEYLINVPNHVALSMAYVNGKRLDLQNKYSMADERTNDYHNKTLGLIDSSVFKKTYNWAMRSAREAVTYASLNHPILKKSVLEAVMGIIWYLALLVPFVFFIEKLLFCFPDIRKQLIAEVIIFLIVFMLLRFLHPAFQMVRSSLMILLGFIIILITGGITMLFSGKFKENLEDLRKKQGKVTAAEVNTMGVVTSAFLLGLNNMHRRKVRTGLTCLTLVLLTFGMICFTSVQNDIVDEDIAVGKAPYQGMLVRKDRFEPMSTSEVFAYRAKYGDLYDVSQRSMIVGKENEQKKKVNSKIKVSYEKKGVHRSYEILSVLQFNHCEPLQKQIKFLTNNTWFTKEDDDENGEVCPMFIPDKAAGILGVTPQDVDSGKAFITVNGTLYKVKGIFISDSLAKLRDLNGYDILPYNVEAMTSIVNSKVNVFLAKDDDPRIPPEKLFIAPDRSIFPDNSSCITVSVAIGMPKASYKEAKQAFVSFMEQTARPVYYGLDGVAYKGKRIRATSVAGLIDLLIPLLIAGLTVLNTMKGSVYERRNEIFVYNAVGIAPKYVFLMFISEAFVYAVVASVLGYVLSQGTGRILTILNLTGGMNMTFTSLSTIYASLTIAGAVFISTYFPARSAMEISAPAEDAGWSLPDPEGDDLDLDLPFNFGSRGRIAILEFFNRYLLDNGDGSAGRFFAGPPSMEIIEGRDESGALIYIPQILTTIWLKPFDLAVSQKMTISLPTDPDTGEYKGHINLHRISGTRESWIRLNKGFVTLIRKHFLHWRAVNQEEQREMFEAAKAKIEMIYSTSAVAQESVRA